MILRVVDFDIKGRITFDKDYQEYQDIFDSYSELDFEDRTFLTEASANGVTLDEADAVLELLFEELNINPHGPITPQDKQNILDELEDLLSDIRVSPDRKLMMIDAVNAAIDRHMAEYEAANNNDEGLQLIRVEDRDVKI